MKLKATPQVVADYQKLANVSASSEKRTQLREEMLEQNAKSKDFDRA
jgi:hypothetical protein